MNVHCYRALLREYNGTVSFARIVQRETSEYWIYQRQSLRGKFYIIMYLFCYSALDFPGRRWPWSRQPPREMVALVPPTCELITLTSYLSK